jgi:hypothetical protein
MNQLKIEHLSPFLPHELKMISKSKKKSIIDLTALGRQSGFEDTISGGHGFFT